MEIKNIVKEYNNGEITIVWKPALCIHAMHCWKELIEVFNPRKRPWVNANGASTERIIQQIERCPTDALTYYRNDEKDKKMENKNKPVSIDIIHNGPLMINESITVKGLGKPDEERPSGAAFCRCGKSKNQPYCDGEHVKFPFEN